MRTLVVGDVHGGLKALKQVLERSKYNAVDDLLIFLGDYVDGWSESSETVDYLIGLKNIDFGHEPIFMRGNHDAWCEEWLEYGMAKNIWVENGGQSTIDSYIKTGLITEESHKRFFRSMINYYIDDQNRGFVHGGYNSRKGLGHEKYQSDYYWDRDLLSICMMRHNMQLKQTEGIKSELRSYKHKEVYVGHTTTVNWKVLPNGIVKQAKSIKEGCTEPINVCNLWNLDTGGGWNGKITVMDIDTKEFWQSDKVMDLYPNDRGRN